MKYRNKLWLLALVLISAFVLSACEGATLQNVPAGLQGEVEVDLSSDVAEFSGVVDAISSTSWTVAGVGVGLTSQTEIKGDLSVGDLAKVEASIQEDGSLLALEIKPVEEQMDDEIEADLVHDDEVEFTGVVESMTDKAWTVAGSVVMITPQTEIEDGIQVGDLVKVEATRDENGLLTAREIKLADDDLEKEDLDNELEFIGFVESIADEAWTVAEIEFLITPQTEIEDGIQVGDLVKVKATRDENGLLTAREIKFADDDDVKKKDMHEDEVEFTGLVDSITDGAWTVAGIEVMITPQTKIEEGIQIGDLVKVEAMQDEEGSLVALEIERVDDDDLDDDDDGFSDEDEDDDDHGDDDHGGSDHSDDDHSDDDHSDDDHGDGDHEEREDDD